MYILHVDLLLVEFVCGGINMRVISSVMNCCIIIIIIERKMPCRQCFLERIIIWVVEQL